MVELSYNYTTIRKGDIMTILPKVLPINELKNTANISKICKESKTPIIITKNGYSDMVLMSVELYEQTIAKLQTALLLNEALNDSENNNEKKELNSFIKELINNSK